MTTGVVVMAYGTPRSLEDIGSYYTDIRRGRPPTEEQLEDLLRRYQAIGGISPLTARTREQVAAISDALEVLAPREFVVRYGAKHSDPKIEAAVEGLADAGCRALVGVVLAPHYSAMSVGEYIERAHDRARARGLPAGFVHRWGEDPILIELLADRVRTALSSIEKTATSPMVIFTAHSLPARIATTGDPYPDEVAHSAALIATVAGLSEHRVAWQSAAKTPEPWLGPDISDVLRELAGEGIDGAVVCPVGFTSDHLEVLYDLDIVASATAKACGISFARTASLNAEPRLAMELARRVLVAIPTE